MSEDRPPYPLRELVRVLLTVVWGICRHLVTRTARDADARGTPPAIDTQSSGVVQGQTTIHGRILRVGGTPPCVLIETMAGETLSCGVSLEMARALGSRLYAWATFSGLAVWQTDDGTLAAVRLHSCTLSSPQTPEQTMQELRRLVGRYFDGIDADAYVAALRGGPPSTCRSSVSKIVPCGSRRR
jgi:hypothetical protein